MGTQSKEERKNADSSLEQSRRPLQVGKASIHDPIIKQPDSAEQGIVPKVPFRLLLSGASGSGKTNVARWLLDKHYVSKGSGKSSFFDDIYLFSPTANIDPVWKNLKGLRKQNRITDVTPERLLYVLRKAQGNVKRAGKEKGKHVLVILDDVIAESQFIHSKEFLTCFIRFRHFLGSVIVMTQSYVKVPRSARIQASHVIMFPSQPTEVDRLYQEYGPYNMSKTGFHDLVERATTPSESEPFPFIYIDRSAPLEKRFRRNLDIILGLGTHSRKKKKSKSRNMKGRKRLRGEEGEEGEEESQVPSHFQNPIPNK